MKRQSCSLRNCDVCQYNYTDSLTCDEKEAIYLIKCSLCDLNYIGSTSRCVRLRIREHFQEVNNGGTSILAQHFRNHNNLHSFKFYILHSNVGNKQVRCKKEFDEILKHRSFLPMGLNQRKPANYTQTLSKSVTILNDTTSHKVNNYNRIITPLNNYSQNESFVVRGISRKKSNFSSGFIIILGMLILISPLYLLLYLNYIKN